MNRQPDFSKKCTDLKQTLLYLSSMERKNFMQLKKTIVLLSYQVNEAFYCTKGLHEMKN